MPSPEQPQPIVVIGVGSLGLCLALNLERAGWPVIGVDVRPAYVEALNNKTYQCEEPGVNHALQEARRIQFTTSLAEALAAQPRWLMLLVATPSLPDGSYDHSQCEAVAEQLLALPNPTQRVDLIVGCTVMPGYCNTLAHRLADRNYVVSYNPEFIAQGTVMHDQLHPELVLIGQGDETAGRELSGVFRHMCQSNPRFCTMDCTSAEIAKIALNCFLTTKISFANAIGDLALSAGADPDAILGALGADSRVGSRYLRYGYGYGGPCLPRDNRALNTFAHNQGHNLLLAEATDEVNRLHLQFQLQQLLQAHKLEEPIVFHQVTYKPDSPLIEESQQLALAVAAAQAGRKVVVREAPQVIEAVRALYGDLFSYEER